MTGWEFARRFAGYELLTIEAACQSLQDANWDLGWGRHSETYGRLTLAIERWIHHTRYMEAC